MTVVNRASSRSKSKPELDLDQLAEDFHAFREAKKLEEKSKAKAEKLRTETLLPAVAAYGHAHGDQNQHLAIELPEPIDDFVRLVRRANVREWFDLEKAAKLARDLGILRRVTKSTVTVTWSGTPRAAADLIKKLVAAGLTEDQVQFTTALDQSLLYGWHLAHKDTLTEKMLDDLIQRDISYSFNPDKA